MSYINPLAQAFAQTTGVARAASSDRAREARQESTNHVQPPVEHEDVETRDAVDLHDEQHQSQDPKKRKKRQHTEEAEAEGDEGLDVRA